MKLCECGCGNPVVRKTARFLSGHNRRGMKNSEEQNRKIGKANSKPKVKKSCETCGKVFHVKQYRKDSARFCSLSCRSKGCFDKIKGAGFGCRCGHTPWNKGKKLPYLKLDHAFKKGHTPWNKGLFDEKARVRRKVCGAIGCAVRKMARGEKNGRKWQELVGWGFDEFRSHMESQFVDGMTWENYGYFWHIDHIIPISAFNIVGVDCIDFKRCWALSNLQPLRVTENLSKRDSLEVPFQPSLGI